MTAFDGHATDSSSKAIYNDPSSVAPADRLYGADAALDKAVGGGVTNKALTTNVAILTTASAHGVAVGKQVLVAGVGAPFDGTFTTVAGTTGSTVKYARTNADVTSAAATGTVSSSDGKPDVYGESVGSYSSQPGAAARQAGYPRSS